SAAPAARDEGELADPVGAARLARAGVPVVAVRVGRAPAAAGDRSVQAEGVRAGVHRARILVIAAAVADGERAPQRDTVHEVVVVPAALPGEIEGVEEEVRA